MSSFDQNADKNSVILPTIEQMQSQLRTLEKVLKQHPELYRSFFVEQCKAALRRTVFFSSADEETLVFLAHRMERVVFPAGSIIVREEGEMPAYVVAEGHIRRWSLEGGRQHLVSTFDQHSVGLVHLYNHDTKSRFNAECMTEVVAYRVVRSDIDAALIKFPTLAPQIIKELSWCIRKQSRLHSTPLLEQKSHKTTFIG